jgi:hypothetical protein
MEEMDASPFLPDDDDDIESAVSLSEFQDADTWSSCGKDHEVDAI